MDAHIIEQVVGLTRALTCDTSSEMELSLCQYGAIFVEDEP